MQLFVWQLLCFLLAVTEGAQLYHSRIWTHLFEFVAFFLFFGLFLLGLVLGSNADLLVSVLDFVQQATDHLFDLFCLVRVSALGKVTEPIDFYLLLARHFVCCGVLRTDHPQMVDQDLNCLNKLLNGNFFAAFLILVQERIGNHVVNFSKTTIGFMP